MDEVAPRIRAFLDSNNRKEIKEGEQLVEVGGAYVSDGESQPDRSRSRERQDQDGVSLKDGKHLEFHPGKVFNISN